MSSHELFQTMHEAVRRSPTAALTTANPVGLRSRLVHPLWNDTGTAGYVLTDQRSPKVSDLHHTGQVALTYQVDDLWLLLSADSAIKTSASEVSRAVADCSARPDGYLPSDFWNLDEIERLVVVELSLTALEMARFRGGELEVKRWRTASPGPS